MEKNFNQIKNSQNPAVSVCAHVVRGGSVCVFVCASNECEFLKFHTVIAGIKCVSLIFVLFTNIVSWLHNGRNSTVSKPPNNNDMWWVSMCALVNSTWHQHRVKFVWVVYGFDMITIALIPTHCCPCFPADLSGDLPANSMYWLAAGVIAWKICL